MRVFATDRHADWLLWKLPELRGRVAYDVRFEIYEPEGPRLTGQSTTPKQGAVWKSIADGYDVVVVDEQGVSHTDDFLAEPGARKLWGDDRVSVVLRPASS